MKQHHALNWIRQRYTAVLWIWFWLFPRNSKTGMFLICRCLSLVLVCDGYLSIKQSFWLSFIFIIIYHPFIITHSHFYLTSMVFIPAYSNYQVLSLARTVGCFSPKISQPSLSPKTNLEDVPTLYRDRNACYSTSSSTSSPRVCCDFAVSDSIAISR